MKKFICIFILIICLLALYSFYIEPNTLSINEYSVINNNLPESFNGLKIIHFSDTLYTDKSNFDNLDNLINKINDTNPDIIIFTGDLINKKVSDKNKKIIIKKLSNLKAKLYKYAILGDNDKDLSKTILESSNFTVLDDSITYIFLDSTTPISITGITDNKDIKNINKDLNPTYNIALIHKPDDAENIMNSNYNLILSGHYLGGQIRIPFIQSIIKTDGATKYNSKRHDYDNGSLFVSYGIGTLKYNARLFNKPSFNVYRLYNK